MHGVVVISMSDIEKEFKNRSSGKSIVSSSKKSSDKTGGVQMDSVCSWYVVDSTAPPTSNEIAGVGKQQIQQSSNSDRIPLAARRGSNAATLLATGKYKISNSSVQPKDNVTAPQMQIRVSVLTI